MRKVEFSFDKSPKGKHLEAGESPFGYMWFHWFPTLLTRDFDLVHGRIRGAGIYWFIFCVNVSYITVKEHKGNVKPIY